MLVTIELFSLFFKLILLIIGSSFVIQTVMISDIQLINFHLQAFIYNPNNYLNTLISLYAFHHLTNHFTKKPTHTTSFVRHTPPPH